MNARLVYEAFDAERGAFGNNKAVLIGGRASTGADKATVSLGDVVPSTAGGGRASLGTDRPLRLNATELREAGDRARDARLWAEAALVYRDYLEQVPGDPAIWIQLGHCLKETGDLTGSETAYRTALAQVPEDPDAHLQLGHVLKLQEKKAAAIDAYRRSFALKPLWSAASELQQLGYFLGDELSQLATPTREPAIFLEISDLFADLLDSKTISGIQRVQLGILSYILAEHRNRRALDIRVVAWQGDELWQLEDEFMSHFTRIYQTIGETEFAQRRELVDKACGSGELVQPVPGDVVVSTGTIYRRSDLVRADAALRRAGARRGAYIHDFIPLTHPEFCDRLLTDLFSPTMADALLNYDFILTASEHVGREARRLLAMAGYSSIPVQAVPEAQSLVTSSGTARTVGHPPSMVSKTGSSCSAWVPSLRRRTKPFCCRFGSC